MNGSSIFLLAEGGVIGVQVLYEFTNVVRRCSRRRSGLPRPDRLQLIVFDTTPEKLLSRPDVS